MSTLHGKLTATLATEYARANTAYHQNVALINRFGDAVKRFNLQAHVRPLDNGNVILSALCERGQDHERVIMALKESGYTIGEAAKRALQFNDGFTIWTAPVRGNSLEFTLLFYVPVDVS